MSVDWGVGRYERTAAQLAPVAGVVVERAAPQPGERVLDLGTGTGNAALLAAARHATVIGVDPAARLLEVARARAADAGLDATFELGEGAAIPVESGTIDATVSVFGVIFAPDRPPRRRSWPGSPPRTAASSSARGCPAARSASSCACPARPRWRRSTLRPARRPSPGMTKRSSQASSRPTASR